MFDRLKFSASALTGLAVGVILALPLFWIGVKTSVGALEHNVHLAFEDVESRQQNMSDEALRLEVNFRKHGIRGYKADFAKVELLRSRLAGSGDFEDKVEVSQQLERALVNVETLYSQVMKSDASAAGSAYCREFGLNWGPMKRYLVDEEYKFVGSVKSYNSVLRTQPVPMIVGYKTFGGLLTALYHNLGSRFGVYFRQGVAWVTYLPMRVWAWATRAAVIPTPPAPMAPAVYTVEALYAPMDEPFYVAQAPVPEEDYPELQYNREQPDMADVEVGQQKAVRDDAGREPYAVPVPTIQRTAVYK